MELYDVEINDVIGIVRATVQSRNIVGMDITELAPVAGNIAPDFLSARRVYKSLTHIFQNRAKLREYETD
jgi:agmatinase